MELAVYNQQGQETQQTVRFAEAIAAQEPHAGAIHQVIRLQRANLRQGTHKTKERGEVKGTSKKPWRQKGTGNARAGEVKSPLWRHGGTIFGPRPRQYGFKLNKKVLKLARRSALALKLKDSAVTVLDAYQAKVPKTKEFLATLHALSLAGEKVLVVGLPQDEVLYRSARNLPLVSVTHVGQLSTYDLMNTDRVLLLKDAVDPLNEQLA